MPPITELDLSQQIANVFIAVFVAFALMTIWIVIRERRIYNNNPDPSDPWKNHV
jgi:hypothetical protein